MNSDEWDENARWEPDEGASWTDDPHSISEPARLKLMGMLGVDNMRAVSDMLGHFHVDQGTREHHLYPFVMSWLEHGIGEIRISPAAVAEAARHLVDHYRDPSQVRHLSHLFKKYVWTTAAEQLAQASERAARERQDGPAHFERVLGVPLRQEAPPNFLQWTRDAMRLCAELRLVGRCPRELPWVESAADIAAEWPEHYQVDVHDLPAATV